MLGISKAGWSGNKTPYRAVYGTLTAVAVLLLGACATPPRTVAVAEAAPVPAPAPPSTEVYFYPAKGQSPEQQERDRYECYLWAKEQTGFDPSSPTLAPHQRIVVEPAPPSGSSAAAGAATGAILGAIVTSRNDTAKGAVVGAITGAMIGAAAESSRQEKAAAEAQQQIDVREAQRIAELERQAERYRRAMAACLQGRGYTVR